MSSVYWFANNIIMDCTTATEKIYIETKSFQENLLLDLIKEICSDPNDNLSQKLKGKVRRIVADCDLTHHSGLHKLSTADDTTSTLLGLMRATETQLTFDEQAELNQMIIQKIQTKLPKFTKELDLLQTNRNEKKSHQELMKEVNEGLDEKLKTLEEQECEKVELMMQWLHHRLQEVMSFGDNSNELLTLKTQILELKSKILHLQILQNIFTETNQSIKSYNEVHKDLKESIKESEKRIKDMKDIIRGDFM